MARRRFQKGQLFKSGRRRKMWVGRWREDMLLDGGAIRQVRRWQVLGTVAGYPTRREAQALLDERLRAVNAGASRPEASMAFGLFAGGADFTGFRKDHHVGVSSWDLVESKTAPESIHCFNTETSAALSPCLPGGILRSPSWRIA